MNMRKKSYQTSGVYTSEEFSEIGNCTDKYGKIAADPHYVETKFIRR